MFIETHCRYDERRIAMRLYWLIAAIAAVK